MAKKRTQGQRERLKSKNLRKAKSKRARLTEARVKSEKANARKVRLLKKKTPATVAAMTITNFVASPCEPTKTIPGTRAKITTLRKRCEAGEELWNQDDGPER